MTIVAQERYTAEKDTILTENLEEVIVTATRTARQLSAVPLPAQIITNKEIRNINSQRLNDLLNEQTGLISVAELDGGEGIQLQGLDSQYTLILIDGVPLIGRSSGTLDLNRIAVGNIKQIEVVKGASSSLYGSEALGGVINIITTQPNTGVATRIDHRTGSFNTHDTGAELSYKKGKTAFTTFLNRYSSNGYDLDKEDALNTVDPYRNYTFTAKLTYELSEKTDILLSGRYFTEQQDQVASETLTGEGAVNEWNVQAKATHRYNEKWDSQLEFYTTRYIATAYLEEPDRTRFSESDFDQLLIRPELRTTYRPNKKNTFTGGLGWSYEALQRTDFVAQPEFNASYLYMQYDAYLTEKLNIIVGARFDHHSEYASQFSPKGAVSYRVNDKIMVKGSMGYGFKAPDFRQLYFDFTNTTVGYTVLGYNAVATALPRLEAEGQIKNIIVPVAAFEEELKPENSIGVNLGVDYKPATTLDFHLNIFRNTVKDLIDIREIADKENKQNVFSYQNVKRVYTQGFEFNASWKPSARLQFSGGYQLLFAKDRDAEKEFGDGTLYGKPTPASPAVQLNKNDYFGLYNRSRHMANFKVFYNLPEWKADANLRATYRSSYGLFDTNGNLYLDRYDRLVNGYAIFDIAFNKAVTKYGKLGVGMDNFLDFTDAENISTLPGRILYGKITVQF